MAQFSQTWLQLENKVRLGRGTLLAAVIITAINMVMALLDVDAYLFFSVSSAYYFTAFGKGLDNNFTGGSWPKTDVFSRTGVLMALVVLVGLLVVWFFSADNKKLLRIAAVAMIVDTMVYMAVSLLTTGSMVPDLVEMVVHVYLIVTLFQAASAWEEMERRRAQVVPEPVNAPAEPWESE